MTPSSLTPSSDPRPLWMGDEDRAAGHDAPPPPPPPASPPGHGPRRRRPPLAALLVASALLGGGASAGILAATGQLDGGATTIIQRPAAATTTVGSSASAGLDAGALYAGAAAGVVDITVKTSAPGASASPFGGAPQGSEATATGTGFFVDDQGHIVTAAHVVDGASSVSVKLQDGTTRKATVLGKDDATDVAVIRIDPSGLSLHPLALGSSGALAVGDPVAAIGDPFGYARSLSTGIVSGVDRTIDAPNGFTVSHAIQTDAAINPGNSGGPILDASGKVVGIADQIATDGSAEQSSGVGFAVPIDLVKSSLSTLEAGGSVEHAYIGIASADAADGGAIASAVTAGGPAAKAGLRSGDKITALGGTPVADSNALVAAIAGHKPGDKVSVTVERGSDTLHLSITLGTQPEQSPATSG